MITRARAILANLEGGEFDERGRPRLAGEAATIPGDDGQLGLFGGAGAATPAEADALETLRGLDVDRTTPIEALGLIARLVAGLREESES